MRPANHNFINHARSTGEKNDLNSDCRGERSRPTKHPAIMNQFAPNYSRCDALTWLRMTAPVTQNPSCLQCAGQDLGPFVLQVVAHQVQDAKLLEHGQRLGEIGHVVLCAAAHVKPWSSSQCASGCGHDENDVDFQRRHRLQWGCDLVVCLTLCTCILC